MEIGISQIVSSLSTGLGRAILENILLFIVKFNKWAPM